MLNVKNTMLDSLLGLVAPHLCCGCGQLGKTFCDNCKYDIITQGFSTCILCNRITKSGICHHHKVAFRQAFVVGYRTGVLQKLIGGFKFRNIQASAKDLADLLDARLPSLPVGTVFVPVPTSPAHIRERGYDHMLLIAQELGKLRHREVKQLLTKETSFTQHHSKRQERFTQVASAFTIRDKLDPGILYLLVDDVVTTGATILEASRVLYEAGARDVWVAVTSRQPLD